MRWNFTYCGDADVGDDSGGGSGDNMVRLAMQLDVEITMPTMMMTDDADDDGDGGY